MSQTTKKPRRTAVAAAPTPATPAIDVGSPEWIARRKAAIAKRVEWSSGPEEVVSHKAVGHEVGIRTSTWLTQTYREVHRKESLMITPQQVIDVLVAAGVKKWVLMGLHGYVGYFHEPRATQDVDVLIGLRERGRAMKAILAAWPRLQVEERPEVLRFADPNDLDYSGHPKVVIDIMLPRDEFYRTILSECVLIQEATQHHIPTLEAALVAKYAALMSLYRDQEKKEYDAGDFRRIVKANRANIDVPVLRRLADQIWQGAADDIERFIELAMTGEPFSV